MLDMHARYLKMCIYSVYIYKWLETSHYVLLSYTHLIIDVLLNCVIIGGVMAFGDSLVPSHNLKQCWLHVHWTTRKNELNLIKKPNEIHIEIPLGNFVLSVQSNILTTCYGSQI